MECTRTGSFMRDVGEFPHFKIYSYTLSQDLFRKITDGNRKKCRKDIC